MKQDPTAMTTQSKKQKLEVKPWKKQIAANDNDAPPQPPVDAQARKIVAELARLVDQGSITLAFLVGVGPGGTFYRNIGGSGNAYEVAGLVEIQKKDLIDVITQGSSPPAAPAQIPGHGPGPVSPGSAGIDQVPA